MNVMVLGSGGMIGNGIVDVLDLSVPLKLSGQSLVDSLGFEASATLDDERRSLSGKDR